MKQVTFIHAADLHLDSPMAGLKNLPAPIFRRLRESTFAALKKITDTALERKVDFVILAGDLFDGEDRSLKAQSKLRNEMLRLETEGISVYAVHGNHDHLSGTWVHLGMPPNVHIFSSDVEVKAHQAKNGTTVNLYGFSYPRRHVLDRKIDSYRKQGTADFHIGILHGNEGGKTEHENYAPFNLKDLLEKHFDYWALGHIHKRMALSEDPPVIYPGNIQGRNRKETGIKGFYCITLNDVHNKLEFIESSEVVWEETVIDAGSASSFQDVLDMARSAIHQYQERNIYTLLIITLNNIQLEDSRERMSLTEELLELLQEEANTEESFVWIVDLYVSENLPVDIQQLRREEGFNQVFFETAEHFEQLDQALEPLYTHQLGRKYLSPLSESDKKLLLQNAESLLIKLLYQS